MSDFLLELRCEEIPARMQKGARAELEKLFRREMDGAGVALGELTIWSTPRRLTLIARDLPTETEAVSEEAKGPPESAPDQAVDGFCRKNGVTRDQLEVREVKGRPTYFAVINTPGRAVADVLAEAIPAIIRDFSWPKSQRWGAASISTESLRWVRPLSGIVALFGGDVVDCEIGGIASGRETKGHRFHNQGAITIDGADDYAAKLRDAHVIVDHEERQDTIRSGAKKAAEDAGLVLVEDEGLVVENAGLTEWPVPLLGRFEDDFLEVPPETIQLTARVNQKYFVCEDTDGKLANAFVCTANIETDDPAVVVDGNRKVLAARLSDARFFWDVDRKKTLEEHAKGLERITFHEKLGTVADKVERVAKLARWLVEEGIVKDADPDQAELAARLCKADLVTEMVGEFPELQGLMGGYYARAEGLDDAVADAIRDHYKPVGQGDDVPTAPVTVAVSLADKLDTVISFFAARELPTGSKDPFALRRATLGILRILQDQEIRVSLQSITLDTYRTIFKQAYERLPDDSFYYVSGKMLENTEAEQRGALPLVEVTAPDPDFDKRPDEWLLLDKECSAISMVTLPLDEGVQWREALENTKYSVTFAPTEYVESNTKTHIDSFSITWRMLRSFFADRLKVQQREAGVRHDLIDAVFALGGEGDLVRLLARVHALQAFMDTDNGTNLLAGYKRASNILKKEDWSGGDENSLSYSPEAAEKVLIDALDNAGPKAAAAVESEDFAGAMTALASLRAPIDAFFDEVTVNDENPDKRAHRLGLLARFRDAVHSVADFSKIEG